MVLTVPLTCVFRPTDGEDNMLYGVNIEEFVAMFRWQRNDLYLCKGIGASIRPLNEWADRWMQLTWPDASQEERLRCWHELLAYVKN